LDLRHETWYIHLKHALKWIKTTRLW